MTEVKEKAGLPSERLIKKLKEKFPAFVSADLTERAKKEGAFEDSEYGTGHYYTSKAVPGATLLVQFVASDGGLGGYCSHYDDAGLRVALHSLYSKNIANNWRMEKRTAEIWNEKTERAEEVTSEAPIVTIGKKEYIWLNKEECDNGTASIRELISLKLLVKAKAFDADGNHNDYGKADPIRKQCEDVVFEDCTEEEKATIIEVIRTDEDGYESATPTQIASPELLCACIDGDLEKVKEILKDSCIDINARCDADGHTPLSAAVYFGYLDIVEELMHDPRLDINARALESDCTVLMIAAQKGNAEMVKQLFKSDNIDLHAKDADGDTALFYAKGKPDIVKLLADKETKMKTNPKTNEKDGKQNSTSK